MSDAGVKGAFQALIAEIEEDLKEFGAAVQPAAQSVEQKVLTVLKEKFSSLLAKL